MGFTRLCLIYVFGTENCGEDNSACVGYTILNSLQYRSYAINNSSYVCTGMDIKFKIVEVDIKKLNRQNIDQNNVRGESFKK